MAKFLNLSIFMSGCLMLCLLSCSGSKQPVNEFPDSGWYYALREDSTDTIYHELYLFESDSTYYWSLADEILSRHLGPWKINQQGKKLLLEHHNDSTMTHEIEILEMTKQELLLSSDGEPLRFYQIQEHFTEEEYLEMVNDTAFTQKIYNRALERKGE